MMKKQQTILVGLLTLLLILMIGTAVWAQTSAGFNLEWHIIGNGGGESNSAHYQVSGTVGQAVAGSVSNRSDYEVSTGYWTFGSQTSIYLPMIVNDS